MPVLYPNPASGSSVSLAVPVLSNSDSVKAKDFSSAGGRYDLTLQVYTTSYRKVKEVAYSNVLPGTAVTLELIDKSGIPLSNGLYFVNVLTPKGKSVLKLLVLR